ncbi:hypothetical protein ACFXKX_23250 [Streptomyces scopuliridis]|uniref:hypothetical protein n=1 Tax=Streptomyces scopuliridis TaxID=452529 RepID=UPI0036AA3F9F
MTRIGSRRRRFLGAVVGGALVGMLVALVFCLPSAAVAVGSTATAGTVASEAVTAGGGYGGQTPGCGRGDRDDTGTLPITPTRGSSVHELLPALHDARDTAGAWGAAQAVLAVTPDRGPPPVAAPSPVDLSVLRV